MKKILPVLVVTILLFTACKKDHNDVTTPPAATVNSWHFKEGSNSYSGVLLFDAQLNTTLQSDSTYTLGIIGPDSNTGNMFNIVLSLRDLNFTIKNYQSGIDGPDSHQNGFFYFEPTGTLENIYKSTDLDPGFIMSYSITAYDPAKDIVSINFSGKAVNKTGGEVTISDGQVTAKIER